jgi:hypothetical protein
MRYLTGDGAVSDCLPSIAVPLAALLLALFVLVSLCVGEPECGGGFLGRRESTVKWRWEYTRACDGDESGSRICKACSDFEP